MTSSVSNRRPPAGWGWAVTSAACMTYGIVWGIPRCLSVLFTDFQEKFNSSNAMTSWISSLIFGFFTTGILLGSFITKLLGPRLTTMAGGLVSCLGLIIMSQCALLRLVYFGCSVTGLGFGFAYGNATSQLSFYFKKKRALAFGIASTGSPLGGMLLPPLLAMTSAAYGLEGSMLILAGISLNLCLCGAVFRPDLVQGTSEKLLPGESNRPIFKSKSTSDFKSNDSVSLCSLSDVISQSLTDLPPPKALWRSSCVKRMRRGGLDMASANALNNNPTDMIADCECDGWRLDGGECPRHCDGAAQKELAARTLRHNAAATTLRERAVATMGVYRSICTDWRMMVYTLVGLLDFLARFIPPWFIVAHAQSLGMSKEQGATLILIFSLTDGATKLIAGYFLSKVPSKLIDRGYEILGLGFAQLAMALSNLLAPLAGQFYSLALYMVGFGIGNAANTIWVVPIITRLVPVENIVQAIGVFHFVAGVGILGGPPIAGYLADESTNYTVVFIFAGGTFIVSALVCWTLFALVLKFGMFRKSEETT